MEEQENTTGNAEEKKEGQTVSFATKCKDAINKLPFNNLAKKVPALAKVAGSHET